MFYGILFVLYHSLVPSIVHMVTECTALPCHRIIKIYLKLQLVFWWVAYIAALFWHVQFQFQAGKTLQAKWSIQVHLHRTSSHRSCSTSGPIHISYYTLRIWNLYIITIDVYVQRFGVGILLCNASYLSPIVGTPLMITLIKIL